MNTNANLVFTRKSLLTLWHVCKYASVQVCKYASMQVANAKVLEKRITSQPSAGTWRVEAGEHATALRSPARDPPASLRT